MREFVFTGDMISKCVKKSSGCFTRSCNCNGIRVALCFLNTLFAFMGRFSSTLFFFDVKIRCGITLFKLYEEFCKFFKL